MKKKVTYLIGIFLACACNSHAQACEDEIEFCADQIKRNYAGFCDKTDSIRFSKYVNTIKNNSSIKDCFYKLSLLTAYFKDEHLVIQDTSKKWMESGDVSININTDSLRVVILKSKSRSKLIDYWISSDKKLIIGTVKQPGNLGKLAAYVIENKRGKLPPGHLKFIVQQFYGKNYAVFVSESKSRTLVPFYFKNENTIQAGALLKFYRLKKYSAGMLINEPDYSPRATFQQIEQGVNLVKIPAGTFENDLIMDSLIRENRNALESGRKLIIDVRNNGGGTILPLMRLLKYLYTGPVKDIESKVLCSDDVIKKSRELLSAALNSGLDSAQINYMNAEIDSFESHKGGWYMAKPEVTVFDSVYKYPEKVAVIINFGCRSATELMILRFLQSRKVLLFGENTYGAVDYLEFLPYVTPHSRYILRIARTKRVIPPGSKSIDNRGIAPDIRIQLKEEKWIDFVTNYLKGG